MTKKTLIQIRTNSKFNVSYQDLTLVPEVELIMLFTEPHYTTNKKFEVLKEQKLSEFRCNSTIDGIAEMIGQLQALQVQLQTFQNLSEGINAVIKMNTTPKTP